MEISLISSSSNPIGIYAMHNIHELLDYILAAIHSLDLQPSKWDRTFIYYSHFIRILLLEDRCMHLYRIHQSNEFLNLHWNIAHTVDSRKKGKVLVWIGRVGYNWKAITKTSEWCWTWMLTISQRNRSWSGWIHITKDFIGFRSRNSTTTITKTNEIINDLLPIEILFT